MRLHDSSKRRHGTHHSSDERADQPERLLQLLGNVRREGYTESTQVVYAGHVNYFVELCDIIGLDFESFGALPRERRRYFG